MARHPDDIWLRDGTREVRVDARTLHGDAADEAYARLIAIHHGYAAYRTKTDREIPVIRLEAVR